MDGALKQQLDKAGRLEVAVTADLQPVARRGDMAVVKRQGMDRLKPGDVVLCIVDGQGELCKVHQCWTISGVVCLEVKTGGANTRSIKEDALLGKVVQVLPGKANLEVMLPTASRLINALRGLTRS